MLKLASLILVGIELLALVQTQELYPALIESVENTLFESMKPCDIQVVGNISIDNRLVNLKLSTEKNCLKMIITAF